MNLSTTIVVERVWAGKEYYAGGATMTIESLVDDRLQITIQGLTFTVRALDFKQIANAAFQMVQP